MNDWHDLHTLDGIDARREEYRRNLFGAAVRVGLIAAIIAALACAVFASYTDTPAPMDDFRAPPPRDLRDGGTIGVILLPTGMPPGRGPRLLGLLDGVSGSAGAIGVHVAGMAATGSGIGSGPGSPAP